MTAAENYELSLLPAAGEETSSRDFQEAMGNIQRDLTAQGLQVHPRMRFQDSADSGGMWYLGQFTIEAAKIVVPALAGVAAVYVGARPGRRVRLKTADIEVEAHTVEELEQVLKLADTRRQEQLQSGLPPEKELNMTKALRVTGNTATLNVEVNVGAARYRVTVTVEPIQGSTINEADAEIALTTAMHEFPQKIS